MLGASESTIYAIIFCIFMFIMGAGLGSFLCCQARRLRRRELHKPSLGSRSVCLHCHHQLRWYDNIPIISWVSARGRCRYCHFFFGWAEFLSEIAGAIAFLSLALLFIRPSFTPLIAEPFMSLPLFGTNPVTNFPAYHPLTWAIFVLTIILTLALLFLAIYDGLYGELPVALLTFAAICAIIVVILRVWSYFLISPTTHNLTDLILPPLVGALILGGLYLTLYLVSHGRWVGDGDWYLAAIIGLVLGSPFAALVALLLSNLTATLIMTPAAAKHKSHRIHFGPFLVLGFLLTSLLLA